MASEEEIKLLREKLALQERLNAAQQEYNKNIETYQEAIESGLFTKEELSNLKNQIESFEELADKTDAAVEKYKNLQKVQEEGKQAAEGLAETLGGLVNLQKDFNETLAGQVVSMLKAEDGVATFANRMKETFDVTNIASMAISEVIKQSVALTGAQDAAAAQFAKSGGNVSLYKGELLKLERQTFTAGVTSDEAGEAFLSLNTNFTDLRNLTTEARTDLAKTTAILQELGIASDVTAGNMQFMTKVLGASASQAAQTQRELFVLARTIDMPPEAMASAFSDAMPKLAAFGDESTSVFKSLQVNARAAGMEVSDVLSIVEQFDTFDGAAQAVGRLNAILGGPFLDSLKMVTTTDPVERMRMLSDAVSDAGLSFDEMSYYQRKALADTMGVDIAQLALMMRDGFDSAVPSVQQSQSELAAMAEQAKEFQTVMEELKQTGMLLAQSLLPFVNVLKDALNVVQGLVMFMPGLTDKVFPPLVMGIGAATIAMRQFSLSLTTAGPLAAAIALAMFAMSDASGGLKIAVGLLTSGVLSLAMAFGVLNVSTGGILLVVGGILTALMGLAQVIMHKAASPGMITIIGLLGVAFLALAPMLAPAALAIAGIGAGLMMAATAMKQVRALSGGLGSAFDTVTDSLPTDVKASGGNSKARIRQANQERISAGKQSQQAAAKDKVDVNVSVKTDDSDLVKLIVKVVEQVNNYSTSGMKANPNVIKNRVA